MFMAQPDTGIGYSPVVAARSVSKIVGGRALLSDVSLVVCAGEIHGLLGPNGSGKTTLLRLLAGVWLPDAGSVDFAGHSRSDIGYVPQRGFLYEELTVAENLRFHARMRGVSPVATEAAAQSAALAPLDNKRLGQLSGGQRQQVMLAVALLHAPRLLLLDEPTTALDRAARRALWTLLRHEASRGRAIVLTSHEETDALECNVITRLAAGRVLPTEPAETAR